MNKALKKQMNDKEDLTKKRDEKCVPVVDGVFEIVNRIRPSVTIKSKEEMVREYFGACEEILKLFKEADVTLSEVGYIDRMCGNRMEILMGQVKHALNMHGDTVIEKTLGKPLDDMTLNDLDKILIDKKEEK